MSIIEEVVSHRKTTQNKIEYRVKLSGAVDNYEWKSKNEVCREEKLIKQFKQELQYVKDLNKYLNIDKGLQFSVSDLNRKPDQICSQFRIRAGVVICEVEWSNKKRSFVLSKEIKARCPELLIKFYERSKQISNTIAKAN